MFASGSIFTDVSLPNAATWFYFSGLLAVALFFKFSRLLSVRNLDLVTLYLLVPGLLLLLEAEGLPEPARERRAWFGYLWLLAGSGYFLLRCLFDLALERRPALTSNLNPSGLAWLAVALFGCLVTVAFRPPTGPAELQVGKSAPAALEEVQRKSEQLVNRQADGDRDDATRFWVERGLALACHLAIVAGLVVVGWRHFQDLHGGMAAAALYLILPYTAMNIGQWHHAWPVALLLWALVAYRHPVVSGIIVGLAVGTVFFPALVLPAWLGFYWRRGAVRFVAACSLTALTCLAAVAVVLWWNDDLGRTLRDTWAVTDWKPWKETTTDGFWKGIHGAYRLPVFIVYAAFWATTAVWPRPKNLAHLLALTAALLIGAQFWYGDQGGVYVLWYLPLVLLLVFRPNLADRQAPPLPAEKLWVRRLAGAAGQWVLRMVKTPEPVGPRR